MAIQVEPTAERRWESLSSDEKLERRFAAWLSATGIEFATAQAEKDYKARAKRYADAVRLKNVPDRVPVVSNLGAFAAAYYGYTNKDMMYDVDKAVDVMMRGTLEFETDTKVTAANSPGLVCEMLGLNMYSWPGHGLPDDEGLQFRDIEYMKADEYDALIRDPSDYWLRVHFPRTLEALEPLKVLRPFVSMYDIIAITGGVSDYGRPDVQAALNKLMQAGNLARTWQQKLAAANKKLDGLGFPSMTGGSSSRAPFDFIGDYLRGTRDIMMDIFRRPEKLIEAMERLTPIMIRTCLAGVRLGGCPVVGFALHKGSDEFMSEEHFKTFWWPTFRKMMMAFIEEGLIVRLFAEGRHDARLETIREELPKGRTIWYFDYTTDMKRAKETIGDVACLQGNVPVALLSTGTPEQTTEYCRKLIDVAGRGGGFVFSTGAGLDRHVKVENVRAMLKTTKEYGVYK